MLNVQCTGHSNKITVFIFRFRHHWVQRNQLLVLKNTSFARQCSNDDLAFMEELWAQCKSRRCLIWNSATTTFAMPPPPRFLLYNLVTPQMCDGRGVAKHHALLSGGPALWRQSSQEQAHPTCPPHVITRYFCFLLMQHYDTDKHSHSHGIFVFFWRFFLKWRSSIG